MTWFLCVNPASGDSVLLFYAAAIEVIGLQINLMIWNFVFWDEMVVLTMHILYGYIYMHWYDFDIMSWTNHIESLSDTFICIEVNTLKLKWILYILF
jgi:hypothetical protein